MVNVAHDREDAKNKAGNCLVIGFLLTAAGVVVAALANPSTEVDLLTGEAVDKGSEFGYLAGLVGIGVGSTLVWVAVIAWAVSLGIRMARTG